MSPRTSHADTITCDQCGTSQPEPVHDGWFEVSRPSPYRRLDDWWYVTRYFCSASCLHARIAKNLPDPVHQEASR